MVSTLKGMKTKYELLYYFVVFGSESFNEEDPLGEKEAAKPT